MERDDPTGGLTGAFFVPGNLPAPDRIDADKVAALQRRMGKLDNFGGHLVLLKSLDQCIVAKTTEEVTEIR